MDLLLGIRKDRAGNQNSENRHQSIGGRNLESEFDKAYEEPLTREPRRRMDDIERQVRETEKEASRLKI